MRHVLPALLPLLGSHLKRLLREGMARRALGFPAVLSVVVLLGTIAVVSVIRGTPGVAFEDPPDPALAAMIADAGLRVVVSDDVESEVAERNAVFGVAQDQWYSRGGRAAVDAERLIRTSRNARWVPHPPPLPGVAQTAAQGAVITSMLIAIYALYGVVFGAGMIARDRDDGTLEVELTLALPKAIHGLSRWLAATLVIGFWVALATLLTASLLGLPDAAAIVRHGLAGSGTAVAIGLASVGRSGIKTGFAASLAAGLTMTTALLGLGYLLPAIGQWLPVASLAAGGSGWVPLLGTPVAAAVAIALFTWRSARA